ncbi:hypothetical protein ATK30_4909 [Amycolatopsis echigonensis]|uniref:Dirigent-like protein n=3 Tax=Pseudonocardiales TaxID=85010 RepID=A0A2N3WJJ3_9PSEU|nr:hypothetical protein Psed_1283 [Pseudonocardia dioxanivorans CB1190]PKV94040.1 hypothetical protein ATK30_4909 [Amycolatopsis niigatensis]
MRRMGLLAAAAAGVLAPLAVALPASAAPAHNQLNIPIIGDLLGGSTHNGAIDRNPRHYRHHGSDYDGSSSVTVYATGADRNGNVSFVIEGRDLPPLMHVTLSSAGLNAACVGGNSLNGATARTDLSGDFNFGATGTTCIDGTYRIDATEQSTPYRTFSADVTVES